MTFDPAISEAIKKAVYESGADEFLSQKIIAWVNAITSGNESINDKEEVFRHLDTIFESIDLEKLDKTKTAKFL